MISAVDYLKEWNFHSYNHGAINESDIAQLSDEELYCLLDFVDIIDATSYLHKDPVRGFYFNLYELPDHEYNQISGYINYINTFRGKTSLEISRILFKKLKFIKV